MEDIFIEDVLSFLLGSFIVLLVWFAVSGLLYMMLDSTELRNGKSLRDYISINIKLPKRERFLTKVDPIYELKNSDWQGWCIVKWELDYTDNNTGLQLLMLLLFYPINLHRYKYVAKGVISLGNKNYTDIDVSLKEYYEAQWFIENAEELEKAARRKELKDKRESLNKVFNENYE
jgi:hypothetical protein